MTARKDWIEPALEIFREACELPADERAAFLDSATGENAELRAHVESMLACDEGESTAFDDPITRTPVRDALSSLAREAESTPADLHADVGTDAAPIPETIGDYRVVRLIARGGMGDVYEAEQDHPRRRVAIKVARTGGATTERIRRFELEAQLLARLDHPGIARIIEAGTTAPEAGAQPFFVMELVEGQSLTSYAEAHLTTAREKLELMVRVAEAVGYAHTEGVIHRDLKPDNVLIDASGAPKVLDFGVAKVEAAGGFGATTLRTEAGRVIGTLGYMAPEQLGGKTEGLGPEADVYSLGVMLYELLSRRLPHELDGVTLTGALAVVTTTDAPLLGTIRPEYRGDIEAVVARALEKDDRYRYTGAAALQEDLERYLRGEPVLARTAGPLRRLTKWARRNAALATAITGLFVVLATAAGILLVKNQEVTTALEDNTRLLDRSLVKQALADADELWPTRREQVPRLEGWIATYQPLVDRLRVHVADKESLAEQSGADFNTIDKLVRDIEKLARSGIFERVQARLRLAESIERITVDDRRADWEAAKIRIRSSDQYHGLNLEPQVGLLPLGQDPGSKLEEFLHFETHSGEIPRRDVDHKLPPMTGDTGLIFVLIPGGKAGEKYWIGAQPTDKKGRNYDALAITERRREELHEEPWPDAFFLSKYEMTQGQWQRFTGSNPSQFRKPVKPVNRVSWHDCDKVLRKLALILPHEVQWEYAVRAGTKHEDAWWTGPEETSLDKAENVLEMVAAAHWPGWEKFTFEKAGQWYDKQKKQRFDAGDNGMAPVGSYRANAFGLHDLGGNVAEWCANVIGYRLTEKQREAIRGIGGPPSLVIRGGSYKRGPVCARSAFRTDTDASVVLEELGVRPAMAIQQ